MVYHICLQIIYLLHTTQDSCSFLHQEIIMHVYLYIIGEKSLRYILLSALRTSSSTTVAFVSTVDS